MRLLVKFYFCLAMLLLGVVLSQSFLMSFKGSFREGLEVPRSDFQYKTCQCQRRSQVSSESGTLGMVPTLFNAPKSPLKGDIFSKYPLYQVYMGLIYYGYHPKGTTIFPIKKHPWLPSNYTGWFIGILISLLHRSGEPTSQ